MQHATRYAACIVESLNFNAGDVETESSGMPCLLGSLLEPAMHMQKVLYAIQVAGDRGVGEAGGAGGVQLFGVCAERYDCVTT